MKEIKRKKSDGMKGKKNARKEETRNIKEDAGH